MHLPQCLPVGCDTVQREFVRRYHSAMLYELKRRTVWTLSEEAMYNVRGYGLCCLMCKEVKHLHSLGFVLQGGFQFVFAAGW